jgi:hypothetical protein
MKRLRSKVTYANVVASLALFLVVAGGSAFATSQFGRESIGTSALKKGAVTPAKLSNKAKSRLVGRTGKTGPRGVNGARGPEGPRGAAGPQGPGATAINFAIPQDGSFHSAGTFGNVKVEASCDAGSTALFFKPSAGSKLEIYGSYNFSGAISGSVNSPAAEPGYQFETTSGPREVYVAVIARDPGAPNFEAFNIHVSGSPKCVAAGMAIPSGG